MRTDSGKEVEVTAATLAAGDKDILTIAPSEVGKMKKDERIKFRRKRVESRIRATKGDAATDDFALRRGASGTSDEGHGLSTGEKQVVESKARLDKLRSETENAITSIRVKADQAESDRRVNEEVNLDARQEKLSEERQVGKTRAAAIDMRWNSLMEMEVPEDLASELQRQKDACEKIIAAKDRLVGEFLQEMKEKDQLYVDSLRRQEGDIDTLLLQMARQTSQLMKAYEEELKEIEEAFRQEREQLLEKNRTEVEALLERRRYLEQNYLEERQRRIEKDQKELEEMREQNAEQFHILKIRLQTEIQNLEQQLENMRSRYQLNQEKLDYNYRVLSERVVENQSTITQHKRKLARLQDSLSSVITKYNKMDRQYRQENAELTEQYKRVTEQYKDLQAKLQRFQAADRQKFKEVWQMNEELAHGMLYKLMEADRVVHQQFLGAKWQPSNPELYEYFCEAMNVQPQWRREGFEDDDIAIQEGLIPAERERERERDVYGDGEEDDEDDRLSYMDEEGNEKEAERRRKHNSKGLTVTIMDGGNDGQGTPGHGMGKKQTTTSSGLHSANSLSTPAAAVHGSRRRPTAAMTHLLYMLCAEAEFLVDERVRNGLELLSPEEGQLAKADSILKALGIESESEIEALLPYFLRNENSAAAGTSTGISATPAATGGDSATNPAGENADVGVSAIASVSGGGVGNEVGALQGIQVEDLVAPDDVVHRLRSFVEARRESAHRRMSTQQSMALKSRLLREERSRKEQREYWKRLTEAVPEERTRVWGVLETGLNNYHSLLQERSQLIEETVALKDQNDELKALLNQYLSSDINEELQIPPAKTILEGLHARDRR